MAGLKPGLMNREIVLKTATKSQDEDTNEVVTDWDLLDETVWAQWLPGNARETWQAQQRIGSYIDGVFRIYDIDPRPAPDTTIVLFENRLYDVKGVTEIGLKEGLDLAVTAHGESAP